MAWILFKDSTNASFVKFDMEPPCRALSPSLEYLDERGLRHLYGRMTWSGADIEDRFWPKRARLTTARKTLPDWTGFCSFWGFSQAFRDCVETFEPGKHEFRPVEIVNKDGSRFPRDYFAVNIRQTVTRAIDWERTHLPSREDRGQRILEGLGTLRLGRDIVMKSAVIVGLHLWIPEEAPRGAHIAVSDQLFDLLNARKLLKTVSYCKVIEA